MMRIIIFFFLFEKCMGDDYRMLSLRKIEAILSVKNLQNCIDKYRVHLSVQNAASVDLKQKIGWHLPLATILKPR